MNEREFITVCVVERNDTKKRFAYEAPSSACVSKGDTVQLTKNPGSAARVIAVDSMFTDTEEFELTLALSGQKELPRLYGKIYMTVYEYEEPEEEPEQEAAVNE